MFPRPDDMQQDYNPSFVPYEPAECGQAMNDAIAELARDTGDDVSAFVGRSLAEIFQLVDETYAELPDFWRVWEQWHAPQPRPEMGDL